MTQLATVIVVTSLAAMACLQVALALGARLGRFAWGGQHDVLPRHLRVGSVIAVAVYGLIAVVLLDRTGSMDLFPDGFSRPAAWVVCGYFVLGVAMNAISQSRAERFMMTPACLVLAVCSAVIART